MRNELVAPSGSQSASSQSPQGGREPFFVSEAGLVARMFTFLAKKIA